MRETRSSKRGKDSPVDGLLPNRKRMKLSPSPRKEEIKDYRSGLESDLSDDDDVRVSAVSAFEKIRQDNIKANKEFFSTLGIFEAKENLRLSTEKPKAKPSQRGIKREKSPPPPRRVSMRLRRMDPTGALLPDFPDPGPAQLENEHERPPDGRLEMKDYLYGQSEPENSDRLCQKITSATDSKKFGPLKTAGDLDSFVKAMMKTRLTVDQVAKVVPDRIFSVAIHPTRDKVLVAGGGKWGRVGLWDVEDVRDDQNGVVTYCPHSRPVNHLIFPTWQQDRLYSSAYDGSLRCAHFEEGVFDEVYSVDRDDDILLRNFDFMTPETMLVAQSDGCVVSVDQRTSGTEAESVYSLQHRSLRNVSIHPVNNNYFLTSCVNGEASVWDVRNLKNGLRKSNSPVVTLNHGKGVNSAYFSPVTGNLILTTSADNKLSIFDSSSLTSDISRQKAINHNNFTGRWLTSFRAVWHPAREDVFMVGSMDRPRQIELITTTGSIVATLMNEEVLGSVCSLNAIHPSRHILVGGNSSGRLHVFM